MAKSNTLYLLRKLHKKVCQSVPLWTSLPAGKKSYYIYNLIGGQMVKKMIDVYELNGCFSSNL